MWSHVFPAAGGSISNMYAFLAARHKMFPGYKEQGLHSIKGQLVMYTSNQVRARKSVLYHIIIYYWIAKYCSKLYCCSVCSNVFRTAAVYRSCHRLYIYGFQKRILGRGGVSRFSTLTETGIYGWTRLHWREPTVSVCRHDVRQANERIRLRRI